tara:strand:+ start:1012 stop:1296 length:285 start_codon:yes stop_codon:yes gene_type:complete
MYQAKTTYLAEALLKEYQKNRTKENLTKCSLIWEMHFYTNSLQAENLILQEKYRTETLKLQKQVEQLKEKLDEKYYAARFKNLGSERFGKANDK